MFVLRMMARPGRQLTETHRAQFPAQGLLRDRDAVFVPDPLRQIDQPPSNDTVHRCDRPALDNPDKRLSLGRVELGRLAWRLAVDKTVRPCSVEPQHPITDRLQTDTANPRRSAT